MINGTENQFELPTPLTLLRDSFFSIFKQVPVDFDESKAIYFKAGF
jgi:hypothetical protein